ncbi:hypothetical protein TSAR_009388 [Trichomalopsis sarcophagae]|uniref:Uncharacterized protein n=1 Tax=Trichomalopsis sarcophagae TaxID=543379 RepID=A0A232EGM9_9HYME|nr:hypothetical protein TSAR_009388 [Trichomalopsis sarcophagae]
MPSSPIGANRVKVHTNHLGTRYSYPICVPSDDRSPLGLVPILWVPCHIPCVNCPNKRHGKCKICGLYLNQTFEKIRLENYGRWIPRSEFVEQPYFFRDNLVQWHRRRLASGPFVATVRDWISRKCVSVKIDSAWFVDNFKTIVRQFKPSSCCT